MNKPLQVLMLDIGNAMNTKKNAMIKKIVLALALVSATPAVSANLVPGIGAQALASDNFAATGSSCVTGFLIPTASCSYGGASASATVSNGTVSIGDITVHAAGNGTAGVMAGGIIQDTLYFQGNIPANGRGTIKMTATGTLTTGTLGTPSWTPYATADLYAGGFNFSPTAMFQNSVGTGNIQNTCYDPGIYSSSGSPYGITLCAFSDGKNLSVSWDFPLSYVSTGLEVRAMLTCNVGGTGGTCDYQDPFTVTLPAGVTFTSAANQLAAVPIPAAAWLFGSGLLGLIGVARRKKLA